MQKIVDMGTRIIFGILFGGLLLLLLFFSNKEYLCKKTVLLSNSTIVCAVLFIVTVVTFLIIVRKKKTESICMNYDRLVLILTIVLFGIQFYISYNILFYTGWDVNGVVSTARAIAYGDSAKINSYYAYSIYPNNLFVTSIEALILKINNMVGIFNGTHELMSIISVNCALSSCSCYLIYKTIKSMLNEKCALIGFIIGAATFGISPWMTICYSDAIGIIFPILMFYIYLKRPDSLNGKLLKYGSIILLGTVGYSLKPQCLIILIGILCVDVVRGISKTNIRKTVMGIGLIFVAAICLVCVNKGLNAVYEKEGVVVDDEYTFGWSHFLMMGLNAEQNGVYSDRDVLFSRSIATAKERHDKNIEVSMQRLKDLGVLGYAKHVGKKMLVTYNDGTYAWGAEGGFYLKIYEEPNTNMAHFLRSIFYSDGEQYMKFSTFEQMCWMLIVLMCFLSVFSQMPKEKSKYIVVLMVSIIGLTLFEALFEVRARYLYTYAPIYCILATYGMSAFYNRIVKIDNKICQHRSKNCPREAI